MPEPILSKSIQHMPPQPAQEPPNILYGGAQIAAFLRELGIMMPTRRVYLQRAKDLKLDKKTIRQYDNHANLHIIPLIDTCDKPAWPGRLGDIKLAKLTAPLATAVQRELMRRVSPPMVRKVMVSFKSVLNEAVSTGKVAVNAAATVKAERERIKRKIWAGVDFPSMAEVAAVVNAITGRWRPLVFTLAFCGLRASEARALEWIDILDLESDQPRLRVRQRAGTNDCEIGETKSTGAQRTVPIPPLVATALRQWKPVCPVDADSGQLRFVFPNGVGKVENHANLYNRGWKPWQIKAGLCEPKRDNAGNIVKDKNGVVVMAGKYNIHALRHFYASVLIDQNMNPKRVQNLLGHATVQFTLDRYSHLFPPDHADDQARFAGIEAAVLAAVG